MKTFRETLKGKPSLAVEAMLTGLEKMRQVDDFILDMDTFGNAEEIHGNFVCVGCAATCAVQEIYGKRFKPQDLEVSYIPQGLTLGEREDFVIFESVVNCLRHPNFASIFNYFGVNDATSKVFNSYNDELEEIINTYRQSLGYPSVLIIGRGESIEFHADFYKDCIEIIRKMENAGCFQEL